jgi:hypothetical protein
VLLLVLVDGVDAEAAEPFVGIVLCCF